MLFSAARNHRISSHKGSHHHASPYRPAYFTTRQATRLTTENHLRSRLSPCVTAVLSYCSHATQHHHPNTPRKAHQRKATPSTPTVSDLTVLNRWENINSLIHSTAPVGLALGPDSPGDDERSPGTLSHPAVGIPTPLSLLMPAFSLP